MAVCGSLQHIFENPLPENPTLLESLSWNQIRSVNSIEQSSFTEIFGELHFKESSETPSSSSSDPSTPSSINLTQQKVVSESLGIIQALSSLQVSSTHKTNQTHKSSGSFSSLHSESLQLCTESLGFESSDDVEDMKSDVDLCWQPQSEEVLLKKRLPLDNSSGECRRSRVYGGDYPPPISSIGKSGKPWVCFKSYRNNGRFVLKEIRIPTQEFLQAYREDGRLKLHFVQPDHEMFLEYEEEDYDDVESIDEVEENVGTENDDFV